MHTTVRPNPNFDGADFECALKAADFDRCHQLIDGNETLEGIIASARLALRERRFLDVIGLLSDFPGRFGPSGRPRRLSRRCLRLYEGLCRWAEADRSRLNDLLPGDSLYDEAYYLTRLDRVDATRPSERPKRPPRHCCGRTIQITAPERISSSRGSRCGAATCSGRSRSWRRPSTSSTARKRPMSISAATRF